MRLCPLLFLLISFLPRIHAADAAPSTVFDLSQWKLQIPGPQEVKALQGYSSPYFFLNAEKEMCFHLDASEKGTTTNAHYVRSELRHLPDWQASEPHTLAAEVRAISHLQPDKVTVLQIHGIMEDGKDAPPLLRVAVNSGNLVAFIKTNSGGDEGESVSLKKQLGSQWVKVEVTVRSQQLVIRVNGVEKLNRSLTFWKFPNYFKAGCYPQATSGTADVFFRKLEAK
jgi:Alginate lyase